MVTIAIVYNEPVSSRYSALGEENAVLGVLEAVEAVHRALLELGCTAIRVPLATPPAQVKEKLKALSVDSIFNLFEGFPGYPETEALVSEISSELGIPYTGCPASVLRLALDKAKTKATLEAAGIDTPRYQLLGPETVSTFHLSYPCIVKPGAEDASHGLTEESVVKDFVSLTKQVKRISSEYDGEALVEEFIDGREFNATVLGNTTCVVLPVSEITYSLPEGMPRILTFAAKWKPESAYFQATKAICPAQISAPERQRIEEIALATFRLLGCRGYARVDMRADKKGRLHVLEVNPNPDISPGTGAARQAEATGMTYSQFVERIVQLSLEKD